tara:strand:+ start:825 stop:1067 length:243 start_codon:yes stop_codon:yes gene_type:complete
MEKTVDQLERDISASFGYVKKDMLMLNDAFSDIHDKIQHLSLNHASLLGEIERLKKEISGKSVSKIKTKKVVKKRPVRKK